MCQPDPSPPSGETSGGDLGDRGGEDFEQLYPELRRLARQYLAAERKGHTLQATALVHEVYLRLHSRGEVSGEDPVAFMRAAALAMRRILIDHARTRGRQRRGQGARKLSLDALELASTGRFDMILALDEAISRLAESHAEAAEIARLRFFAGLTVKETARALRMSVRTVHREWSYAKARLQISLSGDTT